MKRKRVLVTAALPYSNGRPHVGHLAGCYLPADIYVRFLRLKEIPVRFICGSDDHGVAIKMEAEKQGITPQEIVATYSNFQKNDLKSAGIEFDIFSGTSTSAIHIKESQDFFNTIHEGGFLNKQTSSQFFDQKTNSFLPDRYVKGTCAYCGTNEQNGDQCENCGKILDVDHLKDARSTISGEAATVKETVHWFLDLSCFQEQVASWIDRAELREATRNFVKGLLGTGMVKRSMTRDIDWGIPVPLDDPEANGKVLYVWFDAPIGYVSFTKELCEKLDGSADSYTDWWNSEDCEVLHFIGEDNTIFHCIIWIAMLQAKGNLTLPRGVIVNQFLNMKTDSGENAKISKSKGIGVWVGDYVESGNSIDTLRYYLTSIAPEKARTTFSNSDLTKKNNSDLANTLGNFINRIFSFTIKNYGPVIPTMNLELLSDIDKAFQLNLKDTIKEVDSLLESFAFRAAQERVIEFVRDCNKYVDDKAPWQTKKTDEAMTKLSLKLSLDAIYCLGILLSPFLIDAPKKIQAAFGKQNLLWKDLEALPVAGSAISQPEILFARLEE